MGSHASLYRGHEPSLPNAESEYARSTRQEVRTHLKDEPNKAPNRHHRRSCVAKILAASSCKVSLARTKMRRVETNPQYIRIGDQPSVSVQRTIYPSEYRRID